MCVCAFAHEEGIGVKEDIRVLPPKEGEVSKPEISSFLQKT